ncbi:MAG: hypothetical protein Q7W45_03585 [Bacteroidota bacterium]|nr:hypothetical protein [Bacteroidota bacterium]MDP3143886.1 hypothetical protein [Bacteroidota bacterium]
MKNRFFILIILISWAAKFTSQCYSHQITIDGIKSNSLYKTPLNPEVKQYMTADLHDVRIHDSAKNEVPYVVLSEPLLKSKSDFIEYKIVSQKHFNTYSEIIIANPTKDKISNIAFNINNSDAYKYCAIEGSEDMKQWYSVSAQQELSLAYNDVYTNTYKCIYFPLNDYSYFRLLVDDWHAEPLKINRAGYFKNSVIAGKLNDVVFTKNVSEDKVYKKTIVQLSFSNNQHVDRIDFKIKSPRLFSRNANVYVNRERKLKHNKTEKYREVLFGFELNSNSPLLFDIPYLNEKEVFVEIENKDNPPLEIESISCKQLASYLVCDLNAGNKYTLRFGNNALKLPEYDLSNFVSSTPQLLPEVELGIIKEIPKLPKVTTEKQTTFFETKQFLWLCLGLGSIIIFFFSKSLLKDMATKKED